MGSQPWGAVGSGKGGLLAVRGSPQRSSGQGEQSSVAQGAVRSQQGAVCEGEVGRGAVANGGSLQWATTVGKGAVVSGAGSSGQDDIRGWGQFAVSSGFRRPVGAVSGDGSSRGIQHWGQLARGQLPVGAVGSQQ